MAFAVAPVRLDRGVVLADGAGADRRAPRSVAWPATECCCSPSGSRCGAPSVGAPSSTGPACASTSSEPANSSAAGGRNRVVAQRGHLPGLHPQLRRRQRRRRGRHRRAALALALHRAARRRRDLGQPLVPVADEGRRLRRLRLSSDRADVRDPGRRRGGDRRGARTRIARTARHRPQPRLRSAPLVQRRARGCSRARRSARDSSSATAGDPTAAGRPTTGAATSVAAPGSV